MNVVVSAAKGGLFGAVIALLVHFQEQQMHVLVGALFGYFLMFGILGSVVAGLRNWIKSRA